jgi:hypothetical protein
MELARLAAESNKAKPPLKQMNLLQLIVLNLNHPFLRQVVVINLELHEGQLTLRKMLQVPYLTQLHPSKKLLLTYLLLQSYTHIITIASRLVLWVVKFRVRLVKMQIWSSDTTLNLSLLDLKEREIINNSK